MQGRIVNDASSRSRGQQAGDEPSVPKANSSSHASPFPINSVHLGDCVEAMKRMAANSVDLAIADPPYNLSKGGIWKWDRAVPLPGFGGDWSKVMADWDDMPLADYFAFTLSWLSELKRVVRPSGSLWIHGTYHNVGIINFALQLLEVEIINEVVWFKRNSFPNLSGRRLTASHETIVWAHTGSPKDRKYYFDYEAAKEMACPEDGLKQPGKQMRTVWDIPNNKQRDELQFGKHPTQKPLRLLHRMLRVSAKEGDLLLVPFAGAGSECVAAQQMGVRFWAFETDRQYVDICRQRLEQKASPRSPDQDNGDSNKRTPVRLRTKLVRPRSVKSIPSLIKWTGSKRSQARAIADQMPPYRRYIEPFVGGGAVLFLAGVPGSIASDIYEPLVDLWRLVQSQPDQVIADYERQWTSLQQELDAVDVADLKRGDGIPKYYYAARQRFNESGDPLDLNFLMRTCVNGIVRFNDNGGFNNSFHLSRRGMEPPRFARVVQAWHQVLEGVRFACQDYATTLDQAEEGDFVYLDPPYAGNRQRYIEDLDLERFFAALEALNRRGVRWALSFDGRRGKTDLTHAVPESLYRRQMLLTSGNSAVNKVLNGPVESVKESLYLNF